MRKRGSYRKKFLNKHKGFLGIFYRCAYCGRIITKKKMKVDHIFPFSKGGSNKTWNLTASCEKCNLKKSDRVGAQVLRGYANKLESSLVGILITTAIVTQIILFLIY